MTVALRCWRCACLLMAAALMPNWAFGAGFLDDFDDMNIADGSPVTWSTNPLEVFPGNYDASSGDLALSSTGLSEIQVAWVDTQTFSDVYIRTQGVITPGELGGNLALLGRLDATTLSGYNLYWDTVVDPEEMPTLGFQVLVGGSDIHDGSAQIDIDPNAEVVLELNIVGTQLSAYVWEASGSKPAEPQVTHTLGSHPDEGGIVFASGKAGVGFQDDSLGTVGTYRYFAAQDTPFVDDVGVAGDYDGDDDVDGDDFLIWQRDFGSTTNLAADGDNSGTIDAGDLAVWQGAFGTAPPASVSAVPEPTGMVIAVLAGFLLACHKRTV